MPLFKPSEKQFEKTVGDHSFVFKVPSLKDEIKIDMLSMELLKDHPNPTIYATNVAYMVASLATVTVSAPEGVSFADLDELYDYSSIKRIYDAYAEGLALFFPGLEGDPKTEEPR